MRHSITAFIALATLTCVHLEPTIVHELKTRLGDNARLPCRIEQNDATQNVRWYRGQDDLLTVGTQVHKHRNRIKVEKTTPREWNLIIDAVDQSFADTYLCTLGDSGNRREISVITLIIQEAPKIDTRLSTNSDVSFPEHSDAELICIFTGEPTPGVRWYRGYPKMEPIGISGPVLKIRDISRYARGIYTCNGTNSINEYHHSINVTVTFEPEVRVMTERLYARTGAITVLACLIQGTPLHQAYWTAPGLKPSPINKSNWKYTVIDEQQGNGMPVRFIRVVLKQQAWGVHDFGDYKCHAKGDTTEVIKTVKLIHKDKEPKTDSATYTVAN